MLFRSWPWLVAGAAAEIAVDGFPDLAVGRAGMMLQQVMRAHDHAGGAEAALQPVLLPEPLLDGVQLVAVGEAFHRGDFAAVGLHRQYGTGLDRASVQQHGAGAAQRGLTADVGAGKPGDFAQEVHQQQTRLHGGALIYSIDADCDVLLHMSP
jgi:hypothetical protein